MNSPFFPEGLPNKNRWGLLESNAARQTDINTRLTTAVETNEAVTSSVVELQPSVDKQLCTVKCDRQTVDVYVTTVRMRWQGTSHRPLWRHRVQVLQLTRYSIHLCNNSSSCMSHYIHTTQRSSITAEPQTPITDQYFFGKISNIIHYLVRGLGPAHE